MKLSLQMQGIGAIERELGNITEPEKISRTLEQAAMLITGEAMRMCPVHTGRLQKSITPRKINPLTWEIAATADYADYVEYGTYKMTAGTPEDPYVYTGPVSGKYPSYRPYLRSALWGVQDRIMIMFDEAFDEKQQ